MNVEKIYRGRPSDKVFVVFRKNGRETFQPLARRLDLLQHSSRGFGWGRPDAKAAQLAIALIADAVDDKTALRYYLHLSSHLISRLPENHAWELTSEQVYQHVRSIELEEQRAQCKLRARAAILRKPLPITPEIASEIIAMLRLHTGAPVHIAESAFNKALAEMQLEIDHGALTLMAVTPNSESDERKPCQFQVELDVAGRVLVSLPADFQITTLSDGRAGILAPSLERAHELSERLRLFITTEDGALQ